MFGWEWVAGTCHSFKYLNYPKKKSWNLYVCLIQYIYCVFNRKSLEAPSIGINENHFNWLKYRLCAIIYDEKQQYWTTVIKLLFVSNL